MNLSIYTVCLTSIFPGDTQYKIYLVLLYDLFVFVVVFYYRAWHYCNGRSRQDNQINGNITKRFTLDEESKSCRTH